MVGAGLSVAEAISRSQKADDLATAADATMSDEWAIVDESQAQIESDKAKLALASHSWTSSALALNYAP